MAAPKTPVRNTRMVLSSSPVSQALRNAQSAALEIEGLSDLPPEALPIQADTAGLMTEIVPAINTAQQGLREFVGAATPLLIAALHTLDAAGDPIQARAAIMQLATAGSALLPKIGAASTTVGRARDKTDRHIAELPGVQQKLDQSIEAQKTAERHAQAEVERLNREQFFVGIGATWASIMAQRKVEEIQAGIRASEHEVSRFNSMKTVISRLQGHLQTLSARLESLKNAIDLVSGDIRSTEGDLRSETSKTAARIFLQAAQRQVEMLAQEAG